MAADRIGPRRLSSVKELFEPDLEAGEVEERPARLEGNDADRSRAPLLRIHSAAMYATSMYQRDPPSISSRRPAWT